MTVRSFSSLTTWLVACSIITKIGVAPLAAHTCMTKTFLSFLHQGSKLMLGGFLNHFGGRFWNLSHVLSPTKSGQKTFNFGLLQNWFSPKFRVGLVIQQNSRYLLYGFQLSSQVLVSADLASGKPKRARWTAVRCSRMGMVVATATALALWIGRDSIANTSLEEFDDKATGT